MPGKTGCREKRGALVEKIEKKAGGRAGKIALVLCHTATALLNGEVPDAAGAVERFVQSVHEG